MELVKATLWMYGVALERSLQLLKANWGMIFAPLAYGVILLLATFIIAPLGLIGGILLALTMNACMSSGLYLVENVIRSGKTTPRDFWKGFGVYLWDIVMISFILWIPMIVASSVLNATPNGQLFMLFVQLTLYIILNAVPELMYQSHASGVELLAASYQFIVDNWAEWFVPNLLITLGGYLAMRALRPITAALPFPAVIFMLSLVYGLFLSYLLILRGLLFSELNGSNRRARVYRYKTRDSS
ncbi:MAG TPA: hypothetical protein VGB25_00995 [Candidatus Binatia bacterium]